MMVSFLLFWEKESNYDCFGIVTFLFSRTSVVVAGTSVSEVAKKPRELSNKLTFKFL